MSLTNPNTPVSQQDLKDLYEQKILPYIGGAFGLVATGIDSANLYSTTERVIGQWIDGKPLYQKTIDCGTLTSKPDVYIPVSGSSEMNVVNMHGFAEMTGYVQPLPYVHDKVQTNMVAVQFGKSTGINIFARDNTSISGYHAYVTLQYTKTTDSAVESYGTDTTYSTDEHVVGSWIDGRPVYQKVFQPSATISIGTSWTNLHDVSSLNIEVVTKADIHTYPNAGSQDIEVEVYRSTGYIRAKAPSSINYYDNGFLILQYVKSVSS